MPHTYIHLVVHIVFGTKDRLPQIVPEIERDLFAYMGGIIREEGGTPIIINGMPDHVHLLVGLPSDKALAKLVGVVKANSSRWVHQRWPERRAFEWQPGYAAFSVSRSAMVDVQKYFANQKEHHAKMSFQDEYIALLKRHDIAVDERHLWK